MRASFGWDVLCHQTVGAALTARQVQRQPVVPPRSLTAPRTARARAFALCGCRSCLRHGPRASGVPVPHARVLLPFSTIAPGALVNLARRSFVAHLFVVRCNVWLRLTLYCASPSGWTLARTYAELRHAGEAAMRKQSIGSAAVTRVADCACSEVWAMAAVSRFSHFLRCAHPPASPITECRLIGGTRYGTTL